MRWTVWISWEVSHREMPPSKSKRVCGRERTVRTREREMDGKLSSRDN